MSFSFVTYADLGKRKNMKTPASLPIIEKFNKEGELDQVICRTTKDFYYKQTSSAVPIWIRCVLYSIKLIYKKFRLRVWEEKIFDLISSKKLKKTDVVLFLPLNLPRTIEKAKKNKSIIIGMATGAHPLCVEEISKKEIELLGFGEFTAEAEKNNKEFAKIYKKHNYIIVYNEVCKKQAIKYGNIPPEKIFVATSDIDKKKFENIYEERKKNENNKFTVIYVGNIRGKKGIHYLLRAWQDVKIEKKELLLVGYFMASGELKRMYNKMIDSDPTIKVLGFKKDTENYYKIADVFVFPSLAEGSPRVVLEAMYCGLPVITTENAPTIIENGKSGFIVPVQDSSAIAEKINYFYNHPEERKKIAEEARKAILRKEPFCDRVFKIYKEIKKRENL